MRERQEPKCDCIDPGCPACKGKCINVANYTLYRIDMEDNDGNEFCDECASDALESGLFRTEEE